MSVENLNQKLSKLKSKLQKMKNENASLKASSDNHIFINEKLNKALQKFMKDKTKNKEKHLSTPSFGRRVKLSEEEKNSVDYALGIITPG